MRPPESEAGFMETVRDLARLRGWRVMHQRDSRGTEAGWPDLTLVREGTLIFAELKTEEGRITPAQTEWLDALGAVALFTNNVVVQVWRPSDWDAIQEVLK